MHCVLAAELAEFLELQSVGVIFLVLFRNIVSVLAFCASKCDFHAHCRHLLYEIFRIPRYLGAECERKLASLFFTESNLRRRRSTWQAAECEHNKSASAKR